MLVSDFDYFLPEELIAQTPLEKRDNSKLIVLNKENNTIKHDHFYSIPDYLESGDTLIFNNTKVIPARLLGYKEDTLGKIEIFLLNRTTDDCWEVLVKPGKKARPGSKIIFTNEEVTLNCEVLDTTDYGGRIVKFSYQGIFENILDKLGHTPLPPYIKKELSDKERYQTVYSSEDGSVAAPTAGLHFTEKLLEELKNKGINLGFLTLHIGIGTFRPVNVEKIEDHIMHKEYYSLPEETVNLIKRTKDNNKKVIAVGTTAVRTLESIAQKGTLKPQSGVTDIFIYPGFDFKVIDAMITNFHLPKSTLIMLVSALAGKENILRAYEEAVKENYRFFSFGDAMLII